MEKIFELYKKYKMPLLYIIFGALTTLINLAVYFICYDISGLDNTVSVIISWIISVLFAYITNKIFVFESTTTHSKTFLYEISSFFACRLGTGLLDLAIMYISVDILAFNALIMKVISNIVVIILNYIFSKVIIFKKQ